MGGFARDDGYLVITAAIATLRRALQSLREQTCSDFEVLLVADVLDVDTARVAADGMRAVLVAASA